MIYPTLNYVRGAFPVEESTDECLLRSREAETNENYTFRVRFEYNARDPDAATNDTSPSVKSELLGCLWDHSPRV